MITSIFTNEYNSVTIFKPFDYKDGSAIKIFDFAGSLIIKDMKFVFCDPIATGITMKFGLMNAEGTILISEFLEDVVLASGSVTGKSIGKTNSNVNGGGDTNSIAILDTFSISHIVENIGYGRFDAGLNYRDIFMNGHYGIFVKFSGATFTADTKIGFSATTIGSP